MWKNNGNAVWESKVLFLIVGTIWHPAGFRFLWSALCDDVFEDDVIQDDNR